MPTNRLAYNHPPADVIEIIKKCRKCGIEKSLKAFSKDRNCKDGIRNQCRDCCKAYNKINKDKRSLKQKNYYKINTDKLLAQHKIYNNGNIEKISIKRKIYREVNKYKIKLSNKLYKEINKNLISTRRKLYYRANKDKIAIKSKAYLAINKDKIAIRIKKYRNKRYKTDITFRLNIVMSAGIRSSLRNNKNGRHWESLVGYTLRQLRKNFEKLFKLGMTWENYGEWHIDHKIPVSAFNFTKPEHQDFKRCWALSNLQPMWAVDNREKSNKLTKHFQPSLLL